MKKVTTHVKACKMAKHQDYTWDCEEPTSPKSISTGRSQAHTRQSASMSQSQIEQLTVDVLTYFRLYLGTNNLGYCEKPVFKTTEVLDIFFRDHPLLVEKH